MRGHAASSVDPLAPGDPMQGPFETPHARPAKRATSSALLNALRTPGLGRSTPAAGPARTPALDDADEETLSGDVYLAVCSSGTRIGISFFDVQSGVMTCIELYEAPMPGESGFLAAAAAAAVPATPAAAAAADDFSPAVGAPSPSSPSSYSYAAIQLVKYHVRPKVIFASSRSDDALIDALKSPLPTTGTDSGPPAFDVRLERATLFNPEAARKRLEQLRVRSAHGPGITDDGRAQLLPSLINMSFREQVRAAGALLAIVARDELLPPSMNPNDAVDEGIIEVEELTELSLAGFLVVDPVSCGALNIFCDDPHPSSMGIGGRKEGLSLFGLLQSGVMTPAGRRLLRLWLLRPVVSLPAISDRHDAVGLLAASPDIRAAIHAAVKPCRDLPRTLQRLGAAGAGGAPSRDLGDWASLLASLGAFAALRPVLAELAERSPHGRGPGVCRRGARALGECVESVRSLVSGVIDPSQGRGMAVASGVYADLDDLKALHDGLPDLLHLVAGDELDRLPTVIRDALAPRVSVEYIAQVGYAVRIAGGPLPPGAAAHLPDYTLAYSVGEPGAGGGAVGETDGTGVACFYYSEATRDLDGRFGDVWCRILDAEAAVLLDLRRRLIAVGPQLRLAAAVAAEADCLAALAAAARDHGWTRPTLTADRGIRIVNGRHPLLEAAGRAAIPNTTALGGHGAPSVHVITGPNASGKSVYTRQVALIAYLAHIGSFVPAESATIGLVDRIFALAATTGAALEKQSSFLADVSAVAGMLHAATGRSLVILDEFGRGTLAADGAGLQAALLTHLTSLPAPPLAMLCTHLSELAEEAVLPRSPQLAFNTMQVVAPNEPPAGARDAGGGEAMATDAHEDVVFLYRLVPGHASASFGIHCGALAGMPAEILDRARVVRRHLSAREPVPRLATAEVVKLDELCESLTGMIAAFDGVDIRAFLKACFDKLG